MSELAAACGLYHAEVRYLEDGRFLMELLPIVACALGVPTSVLVSGTFAWIPPVPRPQRSVR